MGSIHPLVIAAYIQRTTVLSQVHKYSVQLYSLRVINRAYNCTISGTQSQVPRTREQSQFLYTVIIVRGVHCARYTVQKTNIRYIPIVPMPGNKWQTRGISRSCQLRETSNLVFPHTNKSYLSIISDSSYNTNTVAVHLSRALLYSIITGTCSSHYLLSML